MPSTKEIKDRIESVRQTQKITNAMYLISSTKLRRARADLEHTRPYFEALQAEIKRIFRTSSDIHSRYFYPPHEDDIKGGPYACLVITADKGLAGAYNQNAVKETMQVLAGHPGCKLFVVGEYGRHYFAQHHIPIEQSFLYTAQNPTHGARPGDQRHFAGGLQPRRLEKAVYRPTPIWKAAWLQPPAAPVCCRSTGRTSPPPTRTIPPIPSSLCPTWSPCWTIWWKATSPASSTAP